MPAPLTPHDLLGSWTFDRRIEDRAAGEEHHITGVAVFTEGEGGRIDWDETGTWDGVGPVGRRLVIDDDEVLFTDGRAFHPFVLDTWVVHPCAEDKYRGHLHWDGRRLTVTWRVAGPTKEHDITTRYERIADADLATGSPG